jgi:murein endopeptidase
MERSDREPTADAPEGADAADEPRPAERRVIHVGRVVDEELGDDVPELDDDRDAGSDSAMESDAYDDEDVDDDDLDASIEAPSPAPETKRLGLAPTLLLGGAALWGAVALIRCQSPGELPTTAVPTSEIEAQPEPADVAPEDVEAVPEGQPPARKGDPADDDADATPSGPAGEGWPRPVRADWAEGLKMPTSVGYTIRRGGTLENVANLFKIFHHEILELNPGTTLEHELAPNTRVVVWRGNDAAASESVGFPSAGSLTDAVPMIEGRGRKLLAIPWKTWGTAETVAVLDRVLDAWAARGDVQPILVGNLSNRTGGRLEPHSTHQSGRDVDLGYPQKLAKGAELGWQEITASNLDAAETWTLLRMLVETGAVEEIYIDRSIQKLLHEHAVANESVPEESLSKWMEYPRPTGTRALIQHVPGHTDHLHVRIACPPGDVKCKTR